MQIALIDVRKRNTGAKCDEHRSQDEVMEGREYNYRQKSAYIIKIERNGFCYRQSADVAFTADLVMAH